MSLQFPNLIFKESATDSRADILGFLGATDSAVPCAQILHLAKQLDNELAIQKNQVSESEEYSMKRDSFHLLTQSCWFFFLHLVLLAIKCIVWFLGDSELANTANLKKEAVKIEL